MTTHTKPGLRPANPNFSSGPCAKRPGWSVEALTNAALGRSHRAKIGKTKLEQAIELTREILQVPADYRIGIVPASDTGAVEMALWSLLGERGVDMVAWESFGSGWVTDVVKQLKLPDVRKLEAGYGELPDLAKIDFDRDVVPFQVKTTSRSKSMSSRSPGRKCWAARRSMGCWFFHPAPSSVSSPISRPGRCPKSSA